MAWSNWEARSEYGFSHWLNNKYNDVLARFSRKTEPTGCVKTQGRVEFQIQK